MYLNTDYLGIQPKVETVHLKNLSLTLGVTVGVKNYFYFLYFLYLQQFPTVPTHHYFFKGFA